MQGHPSNRMSQFISLDDLFSYHLPRGDQPARYARIRVAARAFAEEIIATCPECADTTTAIRKVREAVMTANAAIALSLLEEEEEEDL